MDRPLARNDWGSEAATAAGGDDRIAPLSVPRARSVYQWVGVNCFGADAGMTRASIDPDPRTEFLCQDCLELGLSGTMKEMQNISV